jgi:hypothetical protein
MFPGDSAPATAAGVPPGAAAWTSTDARVATVTSQGVVTAIAPGTTRLTVTYQGDSGSALLTVYQDADVLGVTVQGCPASVPAGETTLCHAFVGLRGGASVDVSFRAAWTSANISVARVESGGFILARSAGQTMLLADYRGRTGSLTLSVTGGTEDTLRISANAQQGPFRPGDDVQLWLQGFYLLVSGPEGQLSLEVSDQNSVVAAATTAVPRGGDTFLLTTRFTVPPGSTRLCPVAVLRAGTAALSAPANAMQYCVTVTP